MGTRDRIIGDRDESAPVKPLEKMSEIGNVTEDDDSNESGMLPNGEEGAQLKERINLGKDPLIDINKF